ncbi:RNase H-like domain found in reverse transcriptase [Popillia japonica]|uniref:RNA-directed DNA polymerase n=1 Tax=Popillia japonica TaxID=7064 RepID=A0AAW1KM19_POPJA
MATPQNIVGALLQPIEDLQHHKHRIVTWKVTKVEEFTPNDDNVDVTSIFNIDIESCVTERHLAINPDIAMNYQNDAGNIINTYLNNSRECQNESESCIKMRIVLKDDVPESCIKMRIVLKDDVPVRSKPRRLSYSEQKAVNEIIHDLLQKNVIRPSSSEYSSPIVLVPKKNKELRMCIDYQALNDKTLKENFPLPLIDDLIIGLAKKKFYTTLDLQNGFYHVDMDENSIKYTAFVVPNGQYVDMDENSIKYTAFVVPNGQCEFLKMPFGLTNSPSIFQRYIYFIFQNHIEDNRIQIYMDDLLIATNTIDENLQILKDVINRMMEHNLKLCMDKCQFLQTSIDYLGYRICDGKIQKSLRSFLGLTSYFRRFVKNFALIARPLTDLLSMEKPFVFNDKPLHAFETLKAALIEYPILRIYDPDLETQLQTDACSRGYGAVQSQYHSFELEMLAVKKALEKFRVYLLGKYFTLVTDCNALKMSLRKKEKTRRLFRWSQCLAEYDYAVEHRPGDKMKHVDALSRCYFIDTDNDWLGVAQRKDEELQRLKEGLTETPNKDGLYIANGKIFKRIGNKSLFVMPKGMRRNLVIKTHEDISHLGVGKTLDRLR